MAECSSEELVRARTDPSTFACLSRGEAIGLTVIVEAGLLSLLAILVLFLMVVRNLWWRVRHLREERFRIFHRPMDILLASLFIADVVQAVGAVLSLKWVQSGKVEVGTFCTVQGIIKVIGATGVAFSTLAIAAHTLLGVLWFKDPSMQLMLVIVVTFWILIIALVVGVMMQDRNQNFSVMSPYYYWCWVNRHKIGYGWQLAVEYLWMWITLVFSLLSYILLFLWMRGNLVINDRVWWRFNFTLQPDVDPTVRRLRSPVMLAYPVIYSICVLPLSAALWTATTQGHNNVPPELTFTAVSLFGLSGLFNVVLFLKTRKETGIVGQLMLRPEARPPSPNEGRDDRDRAGTSSGVSR